MNHTLKTYFPWCAEWQAELKQLFKAYVEAALAYRQAKSGASLQKVA